MPRIILLILAVTASLATAQNAAPREEVQKAVPFTAQELRVVRNAASLSTEQLVDLINVYDRLGNVAMMQVLARHILQRDPQNEDALRAMKEIDAAIEVRPANYLDVMSARVLRGERVSDPEAVATQSRVLLLERKPAQAVKLLEALRRVNYGKTPFPFFEDLGAAYRDNGQFAQAETAYRAVLESSTSSAESRQEATRELALLEIESRIAALRALLKKNPAEAADRSAKLLKELPGNELVIEFHAEALTRAGRGEEAARFLEGVKRRTPGPFRLQDDLADAWLAAKNYAKARAAYRELLADPQKADEARKALAQIDLAELNERGAAALKRRDYAAAQKILAQMERRFPKNDEVLGFRAQVLVRTQHADEALRLLLQRKAATAKSGGAFTLQDDLADVYLERKEYQLARAAWQEVLDSPAYDAEMRAAAQKGLREVRKTQLLDQGAEAVREGHAKAARALAAQLRELGGNDPEVEVFDAEITLMDGHPKLAAQSLRDIKAWHYKDPSVPFPGENTLGTALYRTGDWQGAYDSFTKVLNTPGLEPDDYQGALWDRRELLPLLKNTLTLDVGFLDENEGTAWRERVSFASAWWHDWRAIMTLREDTLRMNESSLVGRRNISRFEGSAGLQRKFGQWFAEATVGGAEDHVLYSARAGQFVNDGIGWSLGFYGNERATQSLSLEAFNGRQDRAEFQIGGSISPRWRFDFRAYADWLRIGGDRLGHGFGFNGNLEYVLQTETVKRPEITVGYFGEYSRHYAASQVPRAVRAQDLQVRRALAADAELRQALPANYGTEVFNALVEPEVDRHGLELTLRKKLDLSFTAYLQGGIYYDFVHRQTEFTAAAGLQYWISQDVMLYAELRYNSEGLAGSRGAGVWEGNLGAQATF